MYLFLLQAVSAKSDAQVLASRLSACTSSGEGSGGSVGSVVLEVSQPRQPCSNINRRWQRKGITEAVTQNGRGGWYLRVIIPGKLTAGDEVLLAERPNAGLTVKLATDLFYRHRRDPNLLASLIACPQLSERFKEGLRSRLAEPGG